MTRNPAIHQVRSGAPQLADYDWIVVNTSAGKDSQAMTDYICSLARRLDILNRIVMVHADLGRVEWPGCRELAQVHAAMKGVRFEAVSRPQGDLLAHIEARGRFPDSGNRYCTSDHKRGQVATLFTRLAQEVASRPARILNCLGIRADESPARSKRVPFQTDRRHSSSRRQVDTWLPIHSWTLADVWRRIHASGMPYHYAYDLGMPRLSCCFCIFSPQSALRLAGFYNRNLLRSYVRVEQVIGHTFRHHEPLSAVLDAVEGGYEPTAAEDWRMS